MVVFVVTNVSWAYSKTSILEVFVSTKQIHM